ncbi:MAG: DNA adenine methylase, partial [Candidatus Fonsibacter sp.]
KEVLAKYHDDNKAFLFLDPPYLFSNNKTYIPQQEETDMTQILVDIYEYFQTCKCKVMLIINKLSLLDYLFKGYIKGEYLRIYQMGKTRSNHLIITNY